jgi:beige protein homolog 1
VQDYKYEKLDLSKDITFRDLSKPIGAQSKEKLDTFKSKYFEIVNKQSVGFGQ